MPNNNVFFLLFTFGSKNNNILQLGTILIMKLASACLRVFFQIFSMVGRVNTPLVEHLSVSVVVEMQGSAPFISGIKNKMCPCCGCTHCTLNHQITE
jgi:hypothetical protein